MIKSLNGNAFVLIIKDVGFPLLMNQSVQNWNQEPGTWFQSRESESNMKLMRIDIPKVAIFTLFDQK